MFPLTLGQQNSLHQLIDHETVYGSSFSLILPCGKKRFVPFFSDKSTFCRKTLEPGSLSPSSGRIICLMDHQLHHPTGKTR